jgi:hypothetical protein
VRVLNYILFIHGAKSFPRDDALGHVHRYVMIVSITAAITNPAATTSLSPITEHAGLEPPIVAGRYLATKAAPSSSFITLRQETINSKRSLVWRQCWMRQMLVADYASLKCSKVLASARPRCGLNTVCTVLYIHELST